MERLLISACLLGVSCRYDGGHNRLTGVERLKERYQLIPVCPEITGGLCTPRLPSEIVGDEVRNKAGEDVSAYFEKGAAETLKLALFFECKKALLKERSPSCGSDGIYDGSFTGALAPGSGITARLLKRHGILVFGESEIEKLLCV